MVFTLVNDVNLSKNFNYVHHASFLMYLEYPSGVRMIHRHSGCNLEPQYLLNHLSFRIKIIRQKKSKTARAHANLNLKGPEPYIFFYLALAKSGEISENKFSQNYQKIQLQQ